MAVYNSFIITAMNAQYYTLFEQAKNDAQNIDSPFHKKTHAAFYFLVCQRQNEIMQKMEKVMRAFRPLLSSHSAEELSEVHKSLFELKNVLKE